MASGGVGNDEEISSTSPSQPNDFSVTTSSATLNEVTTSTLQILSNPNDVQRNPEWTRSQNAEGSAPNAAGLSNNPPPRGDGSEALVRALTIELLSLQNVNNNLQAVIAQHQLQAMSSAPQSRGFFGNSNNNPDISISSLLQNQLMQRNGLGHFLQTQSFSFSGTPSSCNAQSPPQRRQGYDAISRIINDFLRQSGLPTSSSGANSQPMSRNQPSAGQTLTAQLLEDMIRQSMNPCMQTTSYGTHPQDMIRQAMSFSAAPASYPPSQPHQQQRQAELERLALSLNLGNPPPTAPPPQLHAPATEGIDAIAAFLRSMAQSNGQSQQQNVATQAPTSQGLNKNGASQAVVGASNAGAIVAMLLLQMEDERTTAANETMNQQRLQVGVGDVSLSAAASQSAEAVSSPSSPQRKTSTHDNAEPSSPNNRIISSDSHPEKEDANRSQSPPKKRRRSPSL